LHAFTKNTQDLEMASVYKRVLGSLSLSCYMYSNGALKNGDLAAASKYIEIYSLVDPTNAEHRYMAAKVAALKGNSDSVFAALIKAIELGFSDFNRMNSDFKSYQNDARFKSLLLVK